MCFDLRGQAGLESSVLPGTLGMGMGVVDAIFLIYFLSLVFFSPVTLRGGQRQRRERAGVKQGEGHVVRLTVPGSPCLPSSTVYVFF